MQAVESVELVEAVHHDVEHAGGDGLSQLLVGLVVPVHRAHRRRHAGREHRVQFPAGRDVEQEALLVGETRHRPAQERLGRVDDAAGTELRHRLAAAGAQVVLVVHVQRRAELLREAGHGDAPDGEDTAV